MPTLRPPLPVPSGAPAALDRDYLDIRARLLDLAAALDRVDRDSRSDAHDPRRSAIARALDVLAGGQPQRATRIQELFSRPYDPQWRTRLDV